MTALKLKVAPRQSLSVRVYPTFQTSENARAAAESAATAEAVCRDLRNQTTVQATAANGSATAAATSATAASNSATAAAGSATAAATSATSASTSATNAGNSATAAGTSATNAANSATAAATSETNAGTSATSAADSATSAAASAAAASTAITTGTIRSDVAQSLTSSAQGVALRNIGAATLLINGKVSASVASGALTVSLTGLDGAAPSATNPVGVYIRDTSGSSAIVWVTAATSVVLSSGSTAGVPTASRAFHLWLLALNDAGTLRLGLINCLNGRNVYPLRGLSTLSSTAEGGAGAADNAHTVYTGVGVTSKTFAVLARLEWSAGLATPGTWATGPSKIVLHQTGTALPGDVVGFSETVDVTTRTTTSTSFVATGITADLLPSSPANPIRISFMGAGDCDAQGNTISFDVNRGATSITALFGRDVLVAGVKQGTGSGLIPQSFGTMDFPNSTALLTFSLMFKVTSGTGTLAARNGGAVTTITTFRVEEIMS